MRSCLLLYLMVVPCCCVVDDGCCVLIVVFVGWLLDCVMCCLCVCWCGCFCLFSIVCVWLRVVECVLFMFDCVASSSLLLCVLMSVVDYVVTCDWRLSICVCLNCLWLCLSVCDDVLFVV